jgi:hypothetical protein
MTSIQIHIYGMTTYSIHDERLSLASPKEKNAIAMQHQETQLYIALV